MEKKENQLKPFNLISFSNIDNQGVDIRASQFQNSLEKQLQEQATQEKEEINEKQENLKHRKILNETQFTNKLSNKKKARTEEEHTLQERLNYKNPNVSKVHSTQEMDESPLKSKKQFTIENQYEEDQETTPYQHSRESTSNIEAKSEELRNYFQDV